MPEVAPRELENIQEELIQGGETLDATLSDKLQAQRTFRKKLKAQKRRERTLLEEKKRNEEALLTKQQHYNTLQEEVEVLRKISEKLRDRNQAQEGEIQDLNHEFEMEKEMILENMRGLEHECGFLSKVVGVVLPSGEVDKIKRVSKYDDNNNYWKVPPFTLQNK